MIQNLPKKIGEIEYLQEHAYQQFKLLKWGNSLLKYNITVFDNTMGVDMCIVEEILH